MAVAAELGRMGEELACRYLEHQGLIVLGRNWRCRHGEVDVIATDRVRLVVCEVKCRSGTACGTPLEAVTPQQLDRVRRAAFCWMRRAQMGWVQVRFDVIGVHVPRVGVPELTHLPGV